MEDGGEKVCPNCGNHRIPSSRYEWHLADALGSVLNGVGFPYLITEQWPLRDRRGFEWFFDLRVAVMSKRVASELIEVNGLSHARVFESGFYRDDEKYRAFVKADLPGFSYRIVANDACRLATVHETASAIVGSLVRRAT